MVHNECNKENSSSTCRKDGYCTKKFPKPFIEET